jgi:hypothetical protein
MTEAQVRVETHGEPHAHLPETLFEGSSESARPSGEVSLGGGPGTAPVEVAARPFTAAPGAATQVNDAAPVAPTRAEGFDGSGIETQPLEPSRLHRAHEDTIAGRVSERGVVVNVDADLTVRVAMSDEGVEVMVEGSTEAIEPLRDLESDLRDALKQDGQDLMEFSARERSERDEAEEDGSQGGFVKTETKKNNRAPVGRGQLLNAVA